ncbi:unnamed protein product [Symbiodinium sp. CCMP2592]|nr:unnamed protein product [Symbiodinium sp. CCMP2592]
MGGCGGRSAKSQECFNPLQLHLGPLQLSNEGFELQPKLNVGIKGKGLTAMAGVRDIRDGLILDGMAMVTKHYMGQGRTIAEVLRNVKAQNPLPVIDDIVAAIPHVAAEIVQLIGADVTSDIVESVRGTLYVYTGVGVSAGVFLGWLDTDGYAMMGALGQASLLKSVALSFRVGIADAWLTSTETRTSGGGIHQYVTKMTREFLFAARRNRNEYWFSFGAALSACERGSQWLLALLLLQDMDDRGVQRDVISCSAAISACEKSAAWQSAVALVETMTTSQIRCDVVCLGAAVAALAAGSEWSRALHMAREMEVASVSLNVVAYGSALKACEMSRSWEQALAILQEMEDRQVHPNVICFNSTISACEKSACWEWALEVLWQMRLRRLPADVISYSAASSACEKCAQWQWSLHLLDDMMLCRVDPDNYTYASSISACQKASEWLVALSLPRQDTIAVAAAISACEKGQKRRSDTAWRSASALLAELAPKRLQRDAICSNAILSAFEKAQKWIQALALLHTRRAPGDIGLIGFSSALGACASADQRDAACRLRQVMTKEGLRPTASSLTVMVSALSGSEALGHRVEIPKLLSDARNAVLDLRKLPAGVFQSLKKGP